MQVILGLLYCAFFLILVWLAAFGYAWHMNAINGTKYDLASLNQVFTILAAQFSGLIVNHSLLNTEIPWMTRWINRSCPDGQGPNCEPPQAGARDGKTAERLEIKDKTEEGQK